MSSHNPISSNKPDQGGPRPSRLRGFVALRSALGPLAALACVVIFFAVADALHSKNHTFVSARNLRTTAVQMSTVAVAALGMTVVIIAGGIDLSVGTALALCATVFAWCLREKYSVFVAVSAALGTGCLAGLINGALISALRVVPFIVTLGTMTIFQGVAKIVANETTVRPLPTQVPAWLPRLVTPSPEPEWLLNVGSGTHAIGIPNFATGVWLALALAVILAVVLRYTVFGRYVFAIGSNESTARLCGVNVPLVKIAVYVLAGLFVGIAGMYQFARLSSGEPTSGLGLELRVIAAVVIGGGSLSGGQGSVLGTLAGAGIMAVIASGCTILGLSNPLQDIIIGAIIVAAVTVDQFRQRRLAAKG